MARYTVLVTETLQRTVVVHAEDEEQATHSVKDRWEKGDSSVLCDIDAGHWTAVDFEVISDV